MVTNTNIQRVDGRLIRTDSGALSQSRFQAIERQRQQRQVSAQIKQQALKLDSEFESNNFGGSLQNFTKQYNSIPASIRKNLKNNPATVKKEIDKRIADLRKLRNKSNDAESRFRSKGQKVKAKGEKAFQEGINKSINELQKGNLLTVSQAKKFANDMEKAAEKGEKAKSFSSTPIQAPKVNASSAELLFFAQQLTKQNKIKKDVKSLSNARLLFFAQELNKINQLNKRNVGNILRIDLPEAPKEQQLSYLKLNSKISITPKDQQNLKKLVNEQNEKLNRQQLKTLVDAPKNVALGVYEVGKEIVVLGKDSLVGSFNYGKNLRKRFEEGEKEPLFNDIAKLGSGTLNVATYVKNNPTKAAQIVTLAVVSGAKGFGEAFASNPVKTTTKSILYLFPGTAIKGGAKAVTLTKGAVTSTTQAIRLRNINKVVTPAVKGLTPTQLKKLNNAVVSASKTSSAAKQSTIIKKSLNPVLKARDIKIVKGESLEKIVKKVKESKDIVKVISKTPKKVTKKPFLKFDGAKVTRISEKSLPTKSLRNARDTTKFIVVQGEKISKITKKQYLAKQVKPVKVTKKQVAIETEKIFNQTLKEKGVVKKGGKTFIDLNAVNRIENAKAPVKAITKKSLLSNKKGQVTFRRQVQVQIQKQTKKIDKRIKIKKKGKKLSKKDIEEIKNIKKDLIKLKEITNFVRFSGFAILLSKINAAIKAADVAQAKTPAKESKTPSKAKTPAKASGVAKAVAQASASKGKTVPKLAQKNKFAKKVAKKTAKKPGKTTKVFRFPLKFSTELPKGEVLAFDLKYRRKGKVVTKSLKTPENKALKTAIKFIKRTPARSFELFISGTTKQKDILRPNVLLKDFRLRKSKNALKLVEIPKSAIKGIKRKK